MSPSRNSRRSGPALADRAYDGLRDRLVTLAIPPGAAINEDALQRELGLGRTPLREAIKRLALENLVVVLPRRGTFAAQIDIADLTAITEVRAVLEGHAAYRAAELLGERDELELVALAAELDAARESADPSLLMALDARVHRFVHRAAANPYLEDTLTRYLNLSLRIWHLVLERLPALGERVHDHGELLEAIADRDAPRASETMVEHIEAFADEIRAVLS
jgi:DNA-binding GntR family transcriptional regulator